MTKAKAGLPPATPPTSAATFRRVALTDLHLDPGNARAHNERNMAAILESLQRFKQAEPLVVQKATGRVIGGERPPCSDARARMDGVRHRGAGRGRP